MKTLEAIQQGVVQNKAFNLEKVLRFQGRSKLLGKRIPDSVRNQYPDIPRRDVARVQRLSKI